tara:strand:- start:1367 stop:2251 length:885 start_codon:yes stop_codon:yes gene_type:complete
MNVDQGLYSGFHLADQVEDTLLNYVAQNRQFQEMKRQSDRDFRFKKETAAEGTRRFDVTTAEGIRQFDVTDTEKKRQFTELQGLRNRQFEEMMRQFGVTTKEGTRQFNVSQQLKNLMFGEDKRQFNVATKEGQREFNISQKLRQDKFNELVREFNIGDKERKALIKLMADKALGDKQMFQQEASYYKQKQSRAKFDRDLSESVRLRLKAHESPLALFSKDFWKSIDPSDEYATQEDYWRSQLAPLRPEPRMAGLPQYDFLPEYGREPYLQSLQDPMQANNLLQMFMMQQGIGGQ